MNQQHSNATLFEVAFHFRYYGYYSEGESREHSESAFFKGTQESLEIWVQHRLNELVDRAYQPFSWAFDRQSKVVNDGGNRLIWADAQRIQAVPNPLIHEA